MGRITIDQIREVAMHNNLLRAVIEAGEHNFESWEEIMKQAVVLLVAENKSLQDELIKIYQTIGVPGLRG